MKRILSIVLCLVMVLSLLTGCGSAQETEQFINQMAEVAGEYAVDALAEAAAENSAENAAEETPASEAEIIEAETSADEAVGIEAGIPSDEAALTGEAEEADAAGLLQNEKKYPVEWNLEDIYASEEAWYEDYSRALDLTDKIADYKGTLSTAQGIYEFMNFFADGEMSEIRNKLSLYQNLKYSLNAADSTAMDMGAKLNQLGVKIMQETAFADEEIFSMSLEERKKIFADPLLEKYAYALKGYTDENTVHYSEETIAALALKGDSDGAGYDIYSTLNYVDVPYPEITTPDGQTVQLTDGVISEIMKSGYDRDFKLEAAEKYYGRLAPYANTFAKTLEYTIRENIASAKLEGYDTFAEYAFYIEDVEPEIFEKIKETAHAMLPTYHKYLEYRKQQDGYENFNVLDIGNPSKVFDETRTYDESCKKMLKVLSVMGDDYTDAVSKVIGNGHVDVYPKEGKQTGAFQTSCSNKDVLPYILLNYSGDMYSTSTLCHEMGHAMYSYFSENNEDLNQTTNCPTIFTQEVASITNEFLLAYDGIDNAASEEEKQAYAYSAIKLIESSVIRQMMYAEFEEYLYDTVEAGGALDAETISDKWMELNREYYGESVDFSDSYRYRWIAIPHLYYGYYVYKYATSCSYAAATSKGIYEGKDGALENYREFLTLGSSAKPSELLKTAGVDPLDDSTYGYIKEVFADLIADYTGD